ncbi:MAG: DUF3696 domain-containing protein [Planctomycetota bacterium]
MIRRISIENFKGISDRQELSLKPITLLFGPNSAGKSTVMHAVHYAQAMLELGDPDVGRTRLGGDLDLGGYQSYVNNHDLTNSITVGFEFAPSEGVELESAEFSFETISVEIRVCWSIPLARPIVDRLAVGFNGDPFAEFGCSSGGSNVWLTNLNLANPILGYEGEGDLPIVLTDKVACSIGNRMALPEVGCSVQFEESEDSEDVENYYRSAGDLLTGACDLLRDELSTFRYVGPIRKVPDRNYRSPRRLDESRWACGLGAWDLLSIDETIRKDANKWLSHESRLDTGYQIVWKTLREFDGAMFDRLRAAAMNGELDENFDALTDHLPEIGRLVVFDETKLLDLSPADLGEGIGQVVPVVVAALSPTMDTPLGTREIVTIVAIEQPELHIHPRMQVALGDLFLSQCSERQFLIETHSEHLILRLLRRIRETSEGELPFETDPVTTEDVAVLYVDQIDGDVCIKELRISEDGEFLDNWPDGFFDERMRELI